MEPSKTRKSWAQVLPQPKTNLPPRKRAKTEDEKEQRRIERILRNRRAARSSREQRRREVEAIERHHKKLVTMLNDVQRANLLLLEELAQSRGDSIVVDRSLRNRNAALALSPGLPSSQDNTGNNASITHPKEPLVQSVFDPAFKLTLPSFNLASNLSCIDHESEVATIEKLEDSEPDSATCHDVAQHPAQAFEPGMGEDVLEPERVIACGFVTTGIGQAFEINGLDLLGAANTERYGIESEMFPPADLPDFADNVASSSAGDLLDIYDFLNVVET